MITSIMKSRYDLEEKEICMDFLSCDEDGIGKVYEIRKRIKYIVKIPGVEKRIYCPTMTTVESSLKRHGILYSKWQLYRLLKRDNNLDEPKLQGALITKA